MIKSVVKELIDQSLHIFAGCGLIVGFAWAFKGDLFWATALTVAILAYREFLQWPSSRWWDPYLDWLFQGIGVFLGLWISINWLTLVI